MFKDTVVLISDLAKIVQNFNDVGLNSVARHIELPVGAVSKLNERELLEVILIELEKKGEDRVNLRLWKDTPIGIPIGVGAQRLNDFYESNEILIDGVCTCTYKDTDTSTLEIVGDSYKIGTSICYTMLDGKIYLVYTFKKAGTDNVVKVRVKEFMNTISHKKLDKYTELVASFEEKEEGFKLFLDKTFKNMKKQEVNIDILLKAKALAKTIKSEALIQKSTREIERLIENIPLPIKNTKNINKQPKLWKETTKIEDSFHYDYFFDVLELALNTDNEINSSKELIRLYSNLTKLFTYTPIEIKHLEFIKR